MRKMLFLLFVSFSAVAQAHPLVDAAERGDLAAVRCMIESGMCTECRNDWGETALNEAVEESQCEVVSYLLKQGANINAVDNQGENVLHEAIEEYLGESKDAVHWGKGKCSGSAVLDALFKDPRLDINAPDPYGRTPLMRFAQAGKVEWVDRLLKMGATVGDVDRMGRTALDRTTDPTIQKLIKARGGV